MEKKNDGAVESSGPNDETRRNTVLEGSGWERRSITDDSRLVELVELYLSLDLEVHLEPLTTWLLESIGAKCESCYINNWEKYKVIYTRERDEF